MKSCSLFFICIFSPFIFFFGFLLALFFVLCEMSSHGANTSPEVQQKRSKQETATNDSRNKLNFTFFLTLIKFLGSPLSAMHSLLLFLLFKSRFFVFVFIEGRLG